MVTNADRRTHCVSVRCNAAELKKINEARGAMTRGAWVRRAALGNVPAPVPELNSLAWIAMSRVAANLNQLAARFNRLAMQEAEPTVAEIDDLRTVVGDFRRALLGDFSPGGAQ
jgi:hypothetical protein